MASSGESLEAQHYEALWQSVLDGFEPSGGPGYLRARPRLEVLVPLLASGVLPSGGVVLDVGCGNGRNARWFAEHGFAAVGLDVSFSGIAVGQRFTALSSARFVNASVFSAPIRASSIDVVYDDGLLHHVHRGDLSRYSLAVRRVLRSSGVWCVNLFHENSKWNDGEARKFLKLDDSQHVSRSFSSEELLDIIGPSACHVWGPVQNSDDNGRMLVAHAFAMEY